MEWITPVLEWVTHTYRGWQAWTQSLRGIETIILIALIMIVWTLIKLNITQEQHLATMQEIAETLANWKSDWEDEHRIEEGEPSPRARRRDGPSDADHPA